MLYTETIMKDGAKLRTSWNSGLWVEESWSADGKTYTKTVWTKEDHGEETTIIRYPDGSERRREFNENLEYRTVIANGVMTVTGYNMKGNTIFDQVNAFTAKKATVTWTYSLNSDGTIRKLIRYEAHTRDSEQVTLGKATWETGKGWKEWYARTYSQPVFAPPSFMDGSTWRGWVTEGDFRGYWPVGRPG